ncbi:MAG: histidine phosphatase family protein [Proteobacteria bacterium]|nr:histidine phosphatase family protein [Pseudomonadota bacterium]
MTQKTLMLLRHAEALDGPSDHERPLSPRGRRQAEEIARHCKESHPTPSRVLCSTALRARQTWGALAAVLDDSGDVHFEASLYLASPTQIANGIGGVADGAGSVLVVGHNPGLAQVVRSLVHPEDPRLALGYPPGFLAVLAFEQEDWAGFEGAQVRLVDFHAPDAD